ncbi:hypothetical protein K461DRAFT_128316 [Myriangium duriaei CBS 260.36]|uniref:BZIP domain-containing protein n=1 Tax=Myriangium duriaei CBS 260.36 TaxID=1168546 RepID=A0A9P4J3C7_9PEZI|nr:hypothetical protein K461DRAFT_128316 [Myriangium duriaei CBS 260.36]
MSPERRRSSNLANLTLHDHGSPTHEFPGQYSPLLPSSQPRSPLMNTADPYHQRTPSLGQIHQQLENEQEAQVNRLLHLIKQQQDQLSSLQTEHPNHNAVPSESTSHPVSAISDPAGPTSEAASHLFGANSSAAISPSLGAAYHSPRSPLQRPTSLSRHSSRGAQVPGSQASNASSPSLRPLSTTRSHDEWSTGGLREEGAFYHAETQMLQRENQMLKHRIRELERQVADLDKNNAPTHELEHSNESVVSSSALP